MMLHSKLHRQRLKNKRDAPSDAETVDIIIAIVCLSDGAEATTATTTTTPRS